MKRSYRWFLVSSLAVFGALGLSACELNESCDPNIDPNCIPTDTGSGDAGGDTNPDTSDLQTYHYILIEDRDDNPSGDRPGADIDAVELNKNGQRYYLSQVYDSDFGREEPSGANRDFNNVLGAPEGQCIGEDPADWDRDNFVSLGGNGGFFIASFQNMAEIKAGDRLTVHACAGDLSEDWDLSVGVATSLQDPNWHMIIDGGVSVVNITVGNLPNVPRN